MKGSTIVMENEMNARTKAETTKDIAEAETSSNLDNNHFYGIYSDSSQMIMHDRKHSALAKGLAFGKPGSGMAFYAKEEILGTLTEADIVLDPERNYQGDEK